MEEEKVVPTGNLGFAEAAGGSAAGRASRAVPEISA